MIYEAHAARVVLAALDQPHGRAALQTMVGTNNEFLDWYQRYGQEKPVPTMTYYEYAIRKFLERLGAVA